jgi:hypothetical protein
LWAGDLPLGDAFWNWAVIGGIAINVSTSLAFLILMAVDEPVAAWIAGYAISVPYNLVAVVGVWRSAARDPGDRLRANLFRTVTLVGMVILTLT